MDNRVNKIIATLYRIIFKKVYSSVNVKKLSKNEQEALFATAQTISNSPKFQQNAQKVAQQIAQIYTSKNSPKWRKYYNELKARHEVALPATYKDFQFSVYSQMVKQNLTMITSIPQNTLQIMQHKYTSSLIEEVVKGKRPVGSFQRELMAHGAKNAVLIARTESAKLQTAVEEVRAKAMGSVVYIWGSSNDPRTRPSHRAMNGVVVFWRDMPQRPLLDGMRGNAGEFPNCRCDCEAVVDLATLTNSKYRVYDYREDKIIEMNQKELKRKIKNGGL